MQRVAQTNSEMFDSLSAIVAATPEDSFRQNGFGRKFASHRAVTPELVKDVFAAFDLAWEYEEPLFGHFVGKNYLVGAAVHAHTDPAPEGFHHVRCNIMLKAPASGGQPVLSGTEIKVEQGQVWICFASLETHASTPVESGERVVVSLGGLIPKDIAEKAHNSLKQGLTNSPQSTTIPAL